MTDQLSYVDELTERPVKGQTYLVLCVRQFFTGRLDWWPVWEPAKTDDFADPGMDERSDWHYHFDPRFLTEEQLRLFDLWWTADDIAAENDREWIPEYGVLRAFSNHRPGIRHAMSYGLPAKGGWLFGRSKFVPTDYRPLECRQSFCEWDAPARDEYWPSKTVTAKGKVQPAKLKNGRPRCPHNGLDLSTVWDGESDTVRCPLHGLEVDMRHCRGHRN